VQLNPSSITAATRRGDYASSAALMLLLRLFLAVDLQDPPVRASPNRGPVYTRKWQMTTMKSLVLLVEDEEALRLFIGDSLRNEGYAVEYACDGHEALEKALQLPVELLILDIMLPHRDGFEVCKELRAAGHLTPVLMLTARSQVEDTVKGLKIGADDYVTKPFDMGELMARVAALLRRAPAGGTPQPNIFRFGSIRVDLLGTEVTRNGKVVNLSAREFQLLRFFIEHRGETLSRDVLLHDVWGYSVKVQTRTVDMRVANLRQQLEDDPKDPQFILTVQGLGYKFRPEGPEANAE
jgi:two-component system, OmpR family, alkaline phosphatase synthesis response regulator PhoP